MFNFIKKLFGFDQSTMKEAGVQIEQQAPYKVETPVVDVPVLVAEETKVEAFPTEVNSQITDSVTQPAPKTKPAAIKAKAKKEGAKKPAPKKEGAKKPTGNRGRKPKAK
jgi:hypothetical protein